MASASGYNHHRFSRALLKKSRRWEPSLTIQLHQHNWRFENSAMLFTYDGPMKPFLLALRAQTIPPALIPFLYDIKPPVSFVDGCLVVEIHDLRKSPEAKSRVIMRPAAEALPQTIDLMLERRGQGGDERLALELESRIISATSPPLYLGTSILATRNAVLALSITAPALPTLSADGDTRSLSDISAMGGTTHSSEFEKMRRLLRAGSTARSAAGAGAPFQPTWSVLRAKERSMEIEREKAREKAEQAAQAQAAAAAAVQAGYAQSQGPPNGVGEGSASGGAGGVSGGEKKKTKKKRPATTAAGGDDEANQAGETKKSKKKKTATATTTTAATQNANEGGGDKKVKIEPAQPAGGQATDNKPKKPKKKKTAPPSSGAGGTGTTSTATAPASS